MHIAETLIRREEAWAMFRLFVGIMLPPDVRASLSRLCCGLAGAKWVDPDSLHLTLRFIGEVGGGFAEDIDAALQQVDAPAFTLMLTGIDCFESGGKAHTLWTGVGKQPLLSHLRDKVESALVRAGCEPERRKFKPHVTLARLRGGESARLGAFMQQYNNVAVGPFPVDSFTLFRSHLGSERAHYESLVDYPLEPVPA